MVLNGNEQTTLYIKSKYHGFYIGTDYIISKNHGFKWEHTRLYLNNHVLDKINIRTMFVLHPLRYLLYTCSVNKSMLITTGGFISE